MENIEEIVLGGGCIVDQNHLQCHSSTSPTLLVSTNLLHSLQLWSALSFTLFSPWNRNIDSIDRPGSKCILDATIMFFVAASEQQLKIYFVAKRDNFCNRALRSSPPNQFLAFFCFLFLLSAESGESAMADSH